MNGLLISFNSFTTFSSASIQSFLVKSPIEPSVVTIIPIVEWSFITFSVPISAASTNGISSGNQGVLTIRGPFSSSYPLALSITYPTQSTRRILHVKSSIFILAILFGTNLGSMVIIVFPPEDCGISSKVLFFSYSSLILGTTRFSTTFFIKVDLPVRTAPTTPRYISPPVR